MQKGVVGRKVAWVSTHHNKYATSLYYQSSPPPRCTGPVRVVVRLGGGGGGGNIVGLPPPSLRLRDFTHPTVNVRLNCIPLSSHNTIQFWTTGQCMGQSVHCKLLHLLAKQIHHLYLSVELYMCSCIKTTYVYIGTHMNMATSWKNITCNRACNTILFWQAYLLNVLATGS